MERMRKESAIIYSCLEGVTTHKTVESQLSMPRLVPQTSGKQGDNNVTSLYTASNKMVR